MQVINNVTLLSIVLTGAALLRERERGTIEHLLAMPVTPFEIMSSKVWAMGLVVLSACAASLAFVVQGLLAVPIGGSIPLFLGGTALHLFATASLGIFMGTAARSMPQFGILVILVVLPLQMLSGASTPARKHARIRAADHVGCSDHAFRLALPGDLVSRRRLLKSCGRSSSRWRSLESFSLRSPGSVPEGHQYDGVTNRCALAAALPIVT